MRDTFVEFLRQKAINNSNILLLTGDLGFGVLNKYRETIPEQFINVGIAEQNMTGVAAGLALEGYKVFTYSIGNFCSLRCLEQIRNDVCYHNVDVKIISVGSGLGYGSLGMSHHATEDVSILRSLPNMKIYAPADSSEAKAVMDFLAYDNGPAYVRLGKIDISSFGPRDVTVNECNVIGEDNKYKLILLTYGSTLGLAKSIVERLPYPCDLYTLAQLKPLPVKNLYKILQGRKYVITLEEHNLCGGVGSSIGEFLLDNGMDLPLIRLGLPDQFISVGGTAEELRNRMGLNVENCIDMINKRVVL